jgi:hypothetical protein
MLYLKQVQRSLGIDSETNNSLEVGFSDYCLCFIVGQALINNLHHVFQVRGVREASVCSVEHPERRADLLRLVFFLDRGHLLQTVHVTSVIARQLHDQPRLLAHRG